MSVGQVVPEITPALLEAAAELAAVEDTAAEDAAAPEEAAAAELAAVEEAATEEDIAVEEAAAELAAAEVAAAELLAVLEALPLVVALVPPPPPPPPPQALRTLTAAMMAARFRLRDADILTPPGSISFLNPAMTAAFVWRIYKNFSDKREIRHICFRYLGRFLLAGDGVL